MLVETPMCVDCGAHAPEAKDDAFVSSSTGWRLTRRPTADGRGGSLDWRCPECWRHYKGRTARPPPDSVRRAIGGGRSGGT
jgi:hypothetical protein